MSQNLSSNVDTVDITFDFKYVLVNVESNIKGTIHPKIKTLSEFAHPQVLY